MKIKNFFKRSKIAIIGDLLFILGLLIAAYVLIDLFLIKANLPEGTCPYITSKPYLYTAIGLLVVSFILSLFEKKKEVKTDE